nr:proteoglycan 4-like [Drosophila suzukii]
MFHEDMMGALLEDEEVSITLRFGTSHIEANPPRRDNEDSVPTPVRRTDRTSRKGWSSSDVELVEDPRVEQRRWRLRKAVNRADGRIPTGAAEVEWASEEPPQDQLAPSSHAEAVVAATWEFRRKCEARRRSEERRLKEMEESPDTRTFVAEGVRWRQQTVVWTWPEGPVEETAATEEPRIWEESGPRVSPLDPRPEQWAPPTPSTGPTTSRTGPSTPMPTGSATVSAEPDEPLERGAWVWPEPVEGGRPPLKRQHSAPEVSEVVTRPKLSRTVDVELVEDPRVEQRRWRLRKAVNRADGRIPTGAAEVEWASEEPPQDQLAPSSHAEAVVAATWEFRRKCEARRRSEERRLKEMEESPEWQAQLRMAEEEEQQLTRTFVAEGVRWRQQTVVWTWPEGPVEETAATEEPRIWEESGPRVSPLDPRPEQWAPPTPSTGPTTSRTGPSTPMPTGSATVSAEPDEPLERGAWVWPEPVEGGRPPLKRQHSAPEVSEVVTRPKLSRTVSAPEGQRWREIASRRRVGGGPAGGATAMAASQSGQPGRRTHPDWRGRGGVG